MWSGKLVTTKPVGQAHLPNIYASGPNTAGKHYNKIIIICVPKRNTWFQLHANGTIRVRRPNPRKPRP